MTYLRTPGQLAGPPPRVVTREYLSDDDLGRMRTLVRMRRLVARGAVHPTVQALTRRVLTERGGGNPRSASQAIRDWCQESITFVPDPPTVELLYEPWYLARLALAGHHLGVDCDDVATLGGAMAKACGLDVQFRAVAFLDTRRPYGHVFTEIRLHEAGGGLVIDVDITREAQGAPPPCLVTRQVVMRS